MNQAKLRSLIYGRYRTAAEMARQMGWGKQKLHRVVNGKQDPNLLDLTDMAHALGKPMMEMVDIFLPQKSPNGQLLKRAREAEAV
ncbi:MAG: helix-turn-helix transcriptional regulator [Oscillospiraceae bacterium]|jgi:DNA-binding phage protein|nr:helix-turn-helix transcriptional regulator [Oscillospiraceae bacterium]